MIRKMGKRNKVPPSTKQAIDSISLPDEVKKYMNPRQVLVSLFSAILKDAESNKQDKRIYLDCNR